MVETAAQLSPASDTTPTRTPFSVTTQLPASTPEEVPLLMVRMDSQLEVERAVTLAASKVKSRRRSRSWSSLRSCSFSRLAS